MSKKIFNIETGPDWSQIPEDHIVVVQDRGKRISNREGVYYTLTPYKKPVNSASYWEK